MSPTPSRRGVPAPRPGPLAVAGVERDRIVVAVDGSAASVRALVWAFRRASELGLRVEALTTWPLHGAVFVREVAGHFCEPRWRAREVQAEAVSRALAAVDDAPPYELRVVNADLVDALVRASARAVMVVTGSDGPVPGRGLRARVTDRLRAALPVDLVLVGPERAAEDAAADTRSETASTAGSRSRQPPRR
jgi:nucleotide-binding universal stress UspA family protein